MKNIFGVLLLSMVQPVLAQTKLEKAITNLENNYDQEKVYLLTDKTQYAAGDKIWFKSFVFDGYNRSPLSTTLFVELYSADKKLIDWKTVLLTNGEGSGDFQLKEDLPEQVYFVRAYTPYMTNFNEDFQMVKTIPVYNPNSPESLVISKSTDWSAKAFPEGGTFINGIPTKFAVRLSSDATLPENWTGKVIDTQSPKVPITTFKSFDKNVAAFTITPGLGKKYQVVIQDNAGKTKTADLPQVADSGLHLEVNSSKEGVKYTLKAVNLKQQLQNYKVVGTINNHLAYKANIKQINNEVSSLIPTKISNGANGVLQLTIFDDQDNLVAQRLCFIKPNNLKIEKAEIIGQSIKQTPRSFNSIDLSPESYFKNYTVLVNEDDGSNKPEEENMLSALWLTGDFTTKVDSPAQYFSKSANTEALDALLISENWKRFDWNSVLSGSVPTIKNNSQKFLSYKVKPIKNNALMINSTVTLMLKLGKEAPSINPFKTDQNGYVYLNNLSFDDPLEVSVFANSDSNKEANADNLFVTAEPLVNPIEFTGHFPSTKYKLVKNSGNKTLPPNISRAINAQKNTKKIENAEVEIEQVKLVGKKKDPKEELDKQLSSGMFSSVNSTIFDFVNENQSVAGYTNILDWLQGKAAGLTFQKNNSGANVPYIRGQQAKLYLDEVPTDASMIATLPVNNIAMVKILKGAGLIGDAVAIYTMKGNMQSKAKEKETKQTNNSSIIKGYDKPSEFLVEMIDENAKVENDTRETLYWNPNLFDSDYVPPRIKFFNNDSAKQYKVLIISFDEDDNILYDQQIFK
ncbi:TonB-dependent receptor plug domain-containing protein [Chryseobacterium tructae]|uniref:TonB-dependent receptor plug domain-containing protein n=1 Tax=Chryseobacterium tructae TaxID=1037380 RepID=A0ABV7XW03_9FLAO|nr:TonB-dependent receptor plug domain-containing protein [Chryseobacterium tructae]MDN3692388.1 TonB-dependent receptor plug domain-containing protein [Chryseobacterium tructae]